MSCTTQPRTASAVATSDLARRVLRALLALTEAAAEHGREISVRTLLTIVPDSPAAVCAMLLVLDAEGYLDGERMRLTLRGFAAAHAPRAIAFERRRQGSMRKAIRVA